MLYLHVFSRFIFYFFGTFLHESAHWIAAKLTFSYTPSSGFVEDEDINGNTYRKEVPGFTIIPKIKKDKVVYGHVLAVPRFKVAFIPIAMAPLVWWVALYYYLEYLEVLYLYVNYETIQIEFNYLSLFRMESILHIYVSLQLFWAGRLSSQDVKMIFVGLFSISSLIVILSLYAIRWAYFT